MNFVHKCYRSYLNFLTRWMKCVAYKYWHFPASNTVSASQTELKKNLTPHKPPPPPPNLHKLTLPKSYYGDKRSHFSKIGHRKVYQQSRVWSCNTKQVYKMWRSYTAMKNGWRSISTINCMESYQDTGWQITRKPSISHTRGREKNDWTNNTNNCVIYVVWPDMTLRLTATYPHPHLHHIQSNTSVYKYGYFANVKKALAIKILFCTAIFQFIPRKTRNPS